MARAQGARRPPKVERLTEALNKQDDVAEAAKAVRGLVEKITLTLGTKRGEIDATLHGELSRILMHVARKCAAVLR